MKDIGIKVKDRPLKEKGARMAVANRMMLIAILVMELIIGFGIVGQWTKKEHTLSYMLIVLAAVIFTQMINLVVFLKSKESAILKYLMLAGFLSVYVLVLLGSKYQLVSIYIFPIAISGMLYFDLKFMKLFCIGAFAANAAQIVNQYAVSGIKADEISIYVIQIVIAGVFCAEFYKCTKTANRFNHDALHSLTDEKLVQEKMLSDILHISGVVQEGASKANEIVDKLDQSSKTVTASVSQIADGTQLTAENIQQQTIMTHNIQESIQSAAERSDNMVTIAKDSKDAINDSYLVVNELKQQSDTIAAMNSHVVDSMNKLQEKALEVQNIAGIIFGISSQTNMLALNASIESARAGEAGRGFAVVANQIRELAEQTKKSMESIAAITEELNENAKTASESVQNSIEATSHQGKLITSVGTGFGKIEQNIGNLTDDIKEVDKRVSELLSANKVIVESISQLSATSEEITASSSEAAGISEENSREADEAKAILEEVISTSHTLDKYMGK